MLQATKITLSAQEKQLIGNSEWILIKHAVINKVIELLNNMLVHFKQTVETGMHFLPAELRTAAPKISKGENYLSLPYVILDYPKFFYKKDVFAIRTMFWWGNFISCTLHLGGRYKILFQENIIKNINKKILDGLYLCINENEWQHHFGEDNYKSILAFTNDEIELLIKKQPFIKIALKYNLEEWDILQLF